MKRIKILSQFFIIYFFFNLITLQAEDIDAFDVNNPNFNGSENLTIVDPIEPVNRIIYSAYKFTYKVLFKPILIGYNFLPSFAHYRIRDFLNNIEEPLDTLNHGLQLRTNAAFESLFRFAINSTVGILGFWDVATPLGVQKKENDFGATLYFYGVPDGPYIMLYGPKNLRDTLGGQLYLFTADYIIPYYDYLVIYHGKYFNMNLDTLGYLLENANTYAKYNRLLNMSFDEYTLVKTTSIARRKQELNNISKLD